MSQQQLQIRKKINNIEPVSQNDELKMGNELQCKIIGLLKNHSGYEKNVQDITRSLDKNTKSAGAKSNRQIKVIPNL